MGYLQHLSILLLRTTGYLTWFLALTGALEDGMNVYVFVRPRHYALAHSRSLLRSSWEQANKPAYQIIEGIKSRSNDLSEIVTFEIENITHQNNQIYILWSFN